MIRLKGITWDHPRGLAPLVASTEVFHSKNQNIEITWDVRSLKDFGDYPIELLAEKYDLILLDHPFIGTGVNKGLIISLDDWVTKEFLNDQKVNSVGKSYESYTWDGKQYALAVDAAAQVSAYCPNALSSLGLKPPTTWDEVFDLTLELPRNQKVGLPLVPTDAICNFISICANVGGNEFLNNETGFNVEIGEKTLDILCRLIPIVHESSLEMNPIQMLDMMSSNDEIVYVPLTFGYSNYSRLHLKGNLIHFTDIPSTGMEPKGSILGGVGLSISSLSTNIEHAVKFATYVASGECQKTTYFEAGGQPGHRLAWTDENVNKLSNNFFKNTIKTLDLSYLRPRFEGYNIFQEKAGKVVHDFLKYGGNPRDAITSLNRLYIKERNNN